MESECRKVVYKLFASPRGQASVRRPSETFNHTAITYTRGSVASSPLRRRKVKSFMHIPPVVFNSRCGTGGMLRLTPETKTGNGGSAALIG